VGRSSRQPADGLIRRASVHGLNHDGRGVARIDDKIVFVDGALPGEEIELEIRRRRRSYDEGRLVSLITASPDRVAQPRCSSFGLCGGCSLQHLDPAVQVEAKQQILLDNLERIGKVSPQLVYAPITGPVWGYRRRARLGVRYVEKKGTVLVGFREKSSSFIADMPACEVLVPQVGQQLLATRELMNGLSCRDRIPQLEVAAGDDAVALVFRNLVPLTAPEQERMSEFARQHGLQVYLQPAGPDSAAPLFPPDPPPLRYHLPEHAVVIEFRPTDFVQINGAVNRQAVNRALELLAPVPDDRVLDLFCGVGNFTLPLARRSGAVTGIEGESALVDRARANAVLNGIENVEFMTADLAEASGFDTTRKWNKVMLDPPRTGAVEMVKLLGRLQPERIVYVSCNPATLARDASLLVHAGYQLAGAGVLDMFPHTNHVESIALFTRS